MIVVDGSPVGQTATSGGVVVHPNDPLYSQQWYLTRLGDIERIWDEYSGAGVTIGVYDGGVQSAHPDLAANYDAGLHVVVNGSPVTGEPDAAPHPHGRRHSRRQREQWGGRRGRRVGIDAGQRPYPCRG